MHNLFHALKMHIYRVVWVVTKSLKMIFFYIPCLFWAFPPVQTLMGSLNRNLLVLTQENFLSPVFVQRIPPQIRLIPARQLSISCVSALEIQRAVFNQVSR